MEWDGVYSGIVTMVTQDMYRISMDREHGATSKYEKSTVLYSALHAKPRADTSLMHPAVLSR